MKKKALIFTASVLIALSSQTWAASPQLFSIVPENDWTYESLNQLAREGLVEGFGGAAYQEGHILTRCEMAAIIAKTKARSTRATPAQQEVIDKLVKEFAAELEMTSAPPAKGSSVEERLLNLEKTKPTFKMSGDARLRYQTNWNQKAKNTDSGENSRLQSRARLLLSSEINEKVSFFGRTIATNTSNYSKPGTDVKTSSTGNVFFERLELQWKNKNTTLNVGRINPTIGQGIIWDWNSMDGALVTYNFGKAQLSGGWADLAPYFGSTTANAILANLKVQVTPTTELTVGHLSSSPNNLAKYKMKQTAVGLKTKQGDFTFTGEYVRNSHDNLPADAQRSGHWERLLWKGIDNNKPGTYGLSLEHLSFGNYAVDSDNNPGTLSVSGGDGIGQNGAKGFGLNFQYVLAKNLNMELKYFRLKPYDRGKAGFDSYQPSYHVVTNFKF